VRNRRVYHKASKAHEGTKILSKWTMARFELKPIALTTAMKRPFPRDGHPRLVRVIVLAVGTSKLPGQMARTVPGHDDGGG
jgi:hypothetical protein